MRAVKSGVVLIAGLVLLYTGIATALDLLGTEMPQTPLAALLPSLVVFLTWGAFTRTWGDADREERPA